jgi:hypothetical protein
MSGHTVEWNPEQPDKADQAMRDVVGEVGVEVDNDTAEQVRQRYQELLNQ